MQVTIRSLRCRWFIAIQWSITSHSFISFQFAWQKPFFSHCLVGILKDVSFHCPLTQREQSVTDSLVFYFALWRCGQCNCISFYTSSVLLKLILVFFLLAETCLQKYQKNTARYCKRSCTFAIVDWPVFITWNKAFRKKVNWQVIWR